MEPLESFYFGLGLITSAVVTLIVWVMFTCLFDASVNPGIFSGVIIVGLYFIYTSVMKGRKA